MSDPALDWRKTVKRRVVVAASLLAIWDIRQRFQWCQVNIRADELPPDAKEYGDLEMYLASQNDGQKLSVPGIRH